MPGSLQIKFCNLIPLACHYLDTHGLSLLGYAWLIITWIRMAYHDLETAENDHVN